MRIPGNSNGFSLVEILVGVGLMGGLAYWGMQTFSVQEKLNKTVEVKHEQQAVFEDISQILSSSDACAATLAGQVADPATSTPQSGVIYYQDDTGAAAQPRYQINTNTALATKYGNGTVQLTGIRLARDAVNNIPAGQLKGSTNLFIRFYFGQNKIKGANQIERKIPLRVQIDTLASRRIVSCSSSGSTSAFDNTYLKLIGGTMRGDIIMQNGTSIIFSSDRRLKDDVQAIGPVLSKIHQLQPVYYRWKKDGQKDQGFIAQDVDAVFPQIVSEGSSRFLQVDYLQFNPIILKGLQEVDQESTSLDKKINRMKIEQQEMAKLLEGFK